MLNNEEVIAMLLGLFKLKISIFWAKNQQTKFE